MPGVSLVRHGGDGSSLESALDGVCFFDDYRSTVHFDGDRLTVASTGYDGYPVEVFETANGLVVLEGGLYDVADANAHVERVAEWVSTGDRSALTEWVRARDGDFLAFVVDRDAERVTVVGDALGRLPLYHATVDDAVVVSRELKAVRDVAEERGVPRPVDDLGVAQTLLFGYRLGTRTLFEGVERLPPAATLTVGETRSVERLFQWDFGSTPHADRSLAENASELADRFRDACRRRAALADTTVLALSGGLDSRAVAAGFDATGTEFRAATFDRPDGSAGDEVRAARAVADALDVEWDEYVARNTGDNRETLLTLKQGMNYLRLSFLIDFLEGLEPERGGATYVTGDGGDKAFPDMRPPRTFEDVDDLGEYAVSANSLFDPSEAAAIAGVSESRLRDSVRERLASYDEADLGDRYVHFLVRERGVNWLCQGEDRNRYYYWSVSPFYAQEFFRYAMGCPPEQKESSELYERFLRELAPEVVDVEYVNFGAPITSAEYRVKRLAYDALSRYPPLQDAVVDVVKRFTNDTTGSTPEVASDLSGAIEDDGAVARALSVPAVERVLENAEAYDEPELYHLLTVASVVDGQRPAAT